MKGYYKIDAIDLWEQYGASLERNATADLLAHPNPKPLLSHNWADEDGEDVLPAPLRVQARDVTLAVLMVGNGEADFWLKYNDLYDHLAAGYVMFFVNEFRRAHLLRLVEWGKPQRWGRIRSTGRVIMRFSVKFREDNPAEDIPNVLIDGARQLWQDGQGDVLRITHLI